MQTKLAASEYSDLINTYGLDLAVLVEKLDEHSGWLKYEISKLTSREELIIFRSYHKEHLVDSLGEKPGDVPLKSEGSYASLGGWKDWEDRMGKNFFEDPWAGVYALQYWIEKENIRPWGWNVVYMHHIERDFQEKSVRIKQM